MRCGSGPEPARKRDYAFPLACRCRADSRRVRCLCGGATGAIGVWDSVPALISSLFVAKLVEVAGVGPRWRSAIRGGATAANADEFESRAPGRLLRRRAV